MSKSWILAGTVPTLPCHGAVSVSAVSVSAEKKSLRKGCTVTYQVEMLVGTE